MCVRVCVCICVCVSLCMKKQGILRTILFIIELFTKVKCFGFYIKSSSELMYFFIFVYLHTVGFKFIFPNVYINKYIYI